MLFEPAIFLAALGITTLELVEAAAVALALYAQSRRTAVFLYAAAGMVVVFAPMFVLGALITLLPDYIVKLTAGILLLYFGQRLVKSARRAVVSARRGTAHKESFEKGELATAFSVGAVEAFEAAIVLVGLLPNGFQSTVFGMAGGIGVVVVATYVLRDQVRKVKQADMKIAVSALLLSFATFWFGEVFAPLDDLLLIPLFLVYVAAVYWFANRPSPKVAVASTPPAAAT
ncbi:MAG: TSUP family transporter [Thaumarchaeota archaeon]|nr:TSUP family transporter [Nitrososphaerota archaeon]